jgi:hypothetical protein
MKKVLEKAAELENATGILLVAMLVLGSECASARS